MKKLISALFFATFICSGAQAQGFAGMQNDPNVMQAINQMAITFGNACQMGDQSSCQSYNYIMSNANAMMGASDACIGGDQMGCTYYGQYYQQMDYDYGQFSQQFSGMNPVGETHEDRMRAIENLGAQGTENWQNRMNEMDRNHEIFMDTLRN